MKSVTGFIFIPWVKGNNMLNLAEFKGERRRVTYQGGSAETEVIQAKVQALQMTRTRLGMDPERTKYSI